MYERKSCLRARQQGKLIEHFVVGATARAASEVVGVNVKTATAFYMRLRQLIGGKQQSFELSGPDSIVYTDTFRSYNALDVSDFHHMRMNHSELFANKQNPINGIENFWNQAKRHMRQFNGIKQESFYWFLKECEWRFNGGNHQQLLKQLKYWYKNAKH